MNKFAFLLLFSGFSATSVNCAPFKTEQLPKIVTNYIRQNEKECRETKDNNGKPGKYQIGNSISRLNFLNHDVEYLIYYSEAAKCSSCILGEEGGNAGPRLVVFANLKGKWQRIFAGRTSGYYFESPNIPSKIMPDIPEKTTPNISKKTIPAPLIIKQKGVPSSTTDEVRYEWDLKTNRYEIKSIEKDIFNLKLIRKD